MAQTPRMAQTLGGRLTNTVNRKMEEAILRLRQGSAFELKPSLTWLVNDYI